MERSVESSLKHWHYRLLFQLAVSAFFNLRDFCHHKNFFFSLNIVLFSNKPFGLQFQDAHARDKEFNVAIELLSLLGERTAQQFGHEYIR